MASSAAVLASSPLSSSFPELADYALGSLKKVGRGRSLNAARVALLLACILMALQATIVYATMEDNIKASEKRLRDEVRSKGIFARVNEEKLQELKALLHRVFEIFAFGMYGFAAAFLLLALLVHRFPLFCSVGGMILYVGFHLIMAYLISRQGSAINVMEFLLMWWVFKIIIILGLIKGIHTAVMYQRERSELAGQAGLQGQPGV